MDLLKEFKPALLFLGKFVLIYVVGNILYGVFIEAYGESPDPVTIFVTKQTATVLNLLNSEVSSTVNPNGPTVFLNHDGDVVISVFEGCNGINVIIVFVAFLIAFGGRKQMLLWFIPLGILTIHILNLFRLGLLYELAESGSRHFHYFHKYVFTGLLYVSVFVLWAIWVKKYQPPLNTATASSDGQG
jgi:exosortase family protein XrtF